MPLVILITRNTAHSIVAEVGGREVVAEASVSRTANTMGRNAGEHKPATVNKCKVASRIAYGTADVWCRLLSC